MAAGKHWYEIEYLSSHPAETRFNYVLYCHSNKSGYDFLVFTNDQPSVMVLVFNPSNNNFQFVSGSDFEYPFMIEDLIEVYDAFELNIGLFLNRISMIDCAWDILQLCGDQPLDMTVTNYCLQYMEEMFVELKKNYIDTRSKEEVYGVLLANLGTIYASYDIEMWNKWLNSNGGLI